MHVPVLIVGGGPVGLTARVLLERWGVRSVLVEKHGQLSPFPRSRLVNVRSMEIFRQLGLEADLTARAFGPEVGRIRFCDTLVGRDLAAAEMVGVGAPIPQSPVIGAVTSQDRLEPVLVAAADAELRFGVELVGLEEVQDHVEVSLLDRESGTTSRTAARYVIAADGAGSTVRERLGVPTSGPGAIARFTTVVFDADLDRWCARRPAGVYFTPRGSLAPLYPEGGWAWFGPTPADVESADWCALVVRALGAPGSVDVHVLRVQHWDMNAFLADRFRRGRVLLAGDAAHAMPVLGGLGMNAGIADVHNLCWKLAGIVHGWAGPGLLDSYETERRPVAGRTLRQAMANTQLMMQVQSRQRERQHGTELELPWSGRFFAQLGLVLGVAYDSGAVVADGSAVPAPSDAVTDYLPTGRPGHRMPHFGLPDGRSSLDALGEWFTVLTADPDHWRLPAGPWPLHLEAISDGPADLCGLGPRGALLVRPDGHVAARWRGSAPSEAVPRALAAISGLAGSPARR